MVAWPVGRREMVWMVLMSLVLRIGLYFETKVD